jgi:hypothetical protein
MKLTKQQQQLVLRAVQDLIDEAGTDLIQDDRITPADFDGGDSLVGLSVELGPLCIEVSRERFEEGP